MRRTLSLLICCLTSALWPPTSARAQTNQVTPTWTFSTYGLQAFGAKSIVITPLRAVGNNGNIIAIGDPIRATTTNSAFSTNLLNGSYYRVEFWSGYNLYAFTNFFDANAVGAVNGGDPIYRAFGQPNDRAAFAPSLPYAMAIFMLKISGVATNASFYGSLNLPVNTNTQVGYVWTVTNATTGAGEWQVSSGGGGGGSATNAYQSQAGNNLITIGTNTGTFVYTFSAVAQTNANMQQWGLVTPTAYSNSINSGVQGWLQLSNAAYQTQFSASNAFYLAAFDPIGAASTVSNILQSQVGEIVITNGSSDATIQAAYNANTNNLTIRWASGDYNLSSAITITNGGLIDGQNARLHWTNSTALALLGKMMTTGTNFGKRLIVQNLKFDGGIYPSGGFANTNYLNTNNAGFFGYDKWTNRTALLVECSGDVTVRGCVFSGWSGNGCLAPNVLGTASFSGGSLHFYDNLCYSNLVDVFLPGAAFETAGFSGAASGTWVNTPGEYAQVFHNKSHDSQIFVGADAKNCQIHDNMATDDYVGVRINSGTGDESVRANSFHHTMYPLLLNDTADLQFSGNTLLAGGNILVSGSASSGITFENNFLGQCNLIFTNGVTGALRFNTQLGTAAWGVDITTNFTGSTGLIIYGNADAAGALTDGSPLSLIAKSGDGAAITNLIHGPTVSGVSGVTVALTKNSDGSTNYGLTVSVGGSGTVTSVDVAQQGFSSSGAVTGAGTITLTQNADKNHLGFSETNINKLAATNSAIIGGLFIDNTNVFQVNTLAGARKFLINTNGDAFFNGGFYLDTMNVSTGAFATADFTNINLHANLDFLGTYGAVNLAFFSVTNTGIWARGDVSSDANYGSVLHITGGTNNVSAPTGIQASNVISEHFIGNGASITNNNAATMTGTVTNPVVSPSIAGNGSGLTNTVSYTHEGTGTNLNIVFNGTLQSFTLTNGPNVWLNWSGANGSAAFQVLTNINIHSTTTFNKFLAGSNGVSTGVYQVTNGWLTVTSMGGTNSVQLVPAIKELQ